VVVGGAGSLEVSPGVELADTAQFPAAWKPLSDAHRAALEIYREEPDLEWTVVSPAALIAPGVRTGHYRAGGDQLLVDAQGESRISAEDYAVAIADEVETPRHIRRRFTVAAA
jgi:putative NADH-flavin reductase